MEQGYFCYTFLLICVYWTIVVSGGHNSGRIDTKKSLESIFSGEGAPLHEPFEKAIFIGRFNEALEYIGSLVRNFEKHTLTENYNVNKSCKLNYCLQVCSLRFPCTHTHEALQRMKIGISQIKSIMLENMNTMDTRLSLFEEQKKVLLESINAVYTTIHSLEFQQTEIVNSFGKLHQRVTALVVQNKIIENTSQDQVEKSYLIESEIERFDSNRLNTRKYCLV